jgi:hypothetical protein
MIIEKGKRYVTERTDTYFPLNTNIWYENAKHISYKLHTSLIYVSPKLVEVLM